MSKKAEAVLVVDRGGLAKKYAARPKSFILHELVQNAWDEQVSKVEITATLNRGTCHIVVEDDAPGGFADLASVYTLFRDSKKAGDPELRGRFELGEKLVIALANWARVSSTKGTVIFEDGKRVMSRKRRLVGTRFEAEFDMTTSEYNGLVESVCMLLVPETCKTVFNGFLLTTRKPCRTITTTLPTVLASPDGVLVPGQRTTVVRLYEPLPGETSHIYEMGIPVVSLGDRWHCDVGQKVPVNWERNNVPESFLRALRVAVLNAMHGELEGEEAQASWVAAAAEDKRATADAVEDVISKRFGKQRVIYDPSDPEANKIAVSQGYTVITGGALSGDLWKNVRRFNVALPAGQVTPSPKPYDPEGHPEQVIPEASWTEAMKVRAEFARGLFRRLVGGEIQVVIVREPFVSWTANFGPGRLCLNFGRLGSRWFALPNREVAVLDLLLHEFVHNEVKDHLSAEMHETATRYGAKLANLCLDEPGFFGVGF